jgi:chromosome segregation ATPase
MKAKYLTLALLGAALAAPACEDRIEEERKDVERAAKEVDERKTEAAKEIGKAEEKLGEKEARAERTAFVNMTNARLEKIDANLSLARDDLKRVPDEKRNELDARLDTIDKNRSHISNELDRAHDVTAADWPGFQANVLRSVQTLESDIDSLYDTIKSQKTT